ncbi:MAG: hypothetical protein ACTHU0_07100 [Kofleriaceae bacterium]
MKRDNIDTTVNVHDVAGLRRAASEAGDLVQVVICDLALGDLDYSEDARDADGYPDYAAATRHEAPRIREILRTWDQARAWAECRTVIIDTRTAGLMAA